MTLKDAPDINNIGKTMQSLEAQWYSSPWFNFLAQLVHSQLVCLLQVIGILNLQKFITVINYFIPLALKSSRGMRSIKYTLHTIQHKQVACMRRKMLFTIFKYLFVFQRIIKVFKYAN